MRLMVICICMCWDLFQAFHFVQSEKGDKQRKHSNSVLELVPTLNTKGSIGGLWCRTSIAQVRREGLDTLANFLSFFLNSESASRFVRVEYGCGKGGRMKETGIGERFARKVE